MKKTQRLIIIVGDASLINSDTERNIAGFHACTVIRTLSTEMLNNVYHFNKNAVYFTEYYDHSWKYYQPIVIQMGPQTDVDNAVLGYANVIEDFPKILDNYDIDVGDHCTQDSAGMAAHSAENCLLCKICRHENEQPEHILYETPNFYVVPGTGAFFEGYVMIVPKDHIMSFGLLGQEKLKEFYGVLKDVSSILRAIYGKKVFAFECSSGRTGEGKHKTSIVHAHFHLAPTDMPVLKEIHKSGLYPSLINREDLCHYGEHPYMLYVDQYNNWFISSDPDTYFPRQHPRQVLAEWMGCYDIYNWRIHPFREKMDVIAHEFRSYCKEHFESLPPWVQRSVKFED